ncbi:MAG TPA: hypothetical protein VGF86_16315 [Candidatus Tumulicola sp.]|jgi:hypothetical protein
MLRYFVLASAIVVGACVVIAGWVNRDLIRIKIASVYAPAHPRPQPSGAPGAGSAGGLRGDAPWALSVFPECLTQTSHSTGPRRYVLGRLPGGAVPIAAPASLNVGDCTIVVAGDAIFVRRGADRFRIPPPARLYRAPGSLALFRQAAGGGNDLRVYEPSKGTTVHP